MDAGEKFNDCCVIPDLFRYFERSFAIAVFRINIRTLGNEKLNNFNVSFTGWR